MVSESTNAELTATTAVLSFDGSRESLLVQVGFGGSGGEEFAWLLPLPGAPEIDAASDEAIVAALDMTAPPERDEYVDDVVPSVCACGGGDDGDLSAGGGVERLGTQVVEGLRFDTIAGAPDAVDRYLDRHSFRLDPHQRESVRDYMDRGWVIVTGTVAAGAPPGGALTPVRFSFETDEAVYPLAMAGDDHAGTMEMDVLTLTPFRPESQTFDEVVVRPASDGTLPEPGDRLELVYAAPLVPDQRDRLSELDPPEDAWLGRYRAGWQIDSLDDDLVLAAGSSSALDYQPLLDEYRSQQRWVPVGRMALISGTVAFITTLIAGPLALVIWMVRVIRRRRA
jgi:hypothetical protein